VPDKFYTPFGLSLSKAIESIHVSTGLS
jgi:hypothetical protein